MVKKALCISEQYFYPCVLTKSFLLLFLLLLLSPDYVFSQDNLSQLDGIVNQNEVDEMQLIGSTDHAEFYLSSDDRLLKISIKSAPIYVASLCIAQNESITVYHSSAALGSIAYNISGKNWITKDEFIWEMRNESMSPDALTERSLYFEEQNWIATTTGMGEPGETEFYFNINAFSSDPIFLAAGIMLASNPDSIDPFPELNANACSDHALVAGSPKPQYPFNYSKWILVPR